jgi:hypothetical protein
MLVDAGVIRAHQHAAGAKYSCCQVVNEQDENAARTVQTVGASTVRVCDVRQALPAVAV